jgi:methionyl-tRNA formyltransferase
MDAGLDTGAMLCISRCPIESTDSSATMYKKLEQLGAPALISTLDNLQAGRALAVVQDNSQSCYAAKIDKSEALIDWSKPAAVLDRQIRAFNPFPAAYTMLGDLRIKVWQAELGPASTQPAGQIISADNSGILVSCGEQSLRLAVIQLPGKSRLPVAEILKSRAELFPAQTLLGS